MKNRGQIAQGAILATAFITSIVTAAGSWIVTNVLSSPETQAAAVAQVDKKVDENAKTQQATDATQDSKIGQLKTSACVQNENIRNLAIVLKAPFVSDPNCK